jgi:hypothetical protein
MSDERLQALKRAWLEEGTEEAGEAYARARINADPDLFYRLVKAVVLATSLIPGARSASQVIAWLDGSPTPTPWYEQPPLPAQVVDGSNPWVADNTIRIDGMPPTPTGTVRVDEQGTLVYMNNIGLWTPVMSTCGGVTTGMNG